MPYLRSPVFRPEAVAPVSLCAAKFCAWVLGTLEAYKWRSGQGHVRLSLVEPRDPPRPQPPPTILLPSNDTSSSSSGGLGVSSESFGSKVRRKRSEQRRAGGPTSPDTKRRPPQLPEPTIAVPRRRGGGGGGGEEASAASAAALARALQPSQTHVPPPSAEDGEALRRARVGRRVAQGRQMTRLAGGAGPGIALGEDGTTFTCSDGVTQMPYEVKHQTSRCSETPHNWGFLI
jgi:hypothetical protein